MNYGLRVMSSTTERDVVDKWAVEHFCCDFDLFVNKLHLPKSI